MYLTFILTVLCLILLSFLVSAIVFWKKYGKKLLKFKENNPFLGNPNSPNTPKEMVESLKMINNLFKNIPKK